MAKSALKNVILGYSIWCCNKHTSITAKTTFKGHNASYIEGLPGNSYTTNRPATTWFMDSIKFI